MFLYAPQRSCIVFHQGLPSFAPLFINSLAHYYCPFVHLPIHTSLCSVSFCQLQNSETHPLDPCWHFPKWPLKHDRCFSIFLCLGHKNNAVFHYFPSQAVKACHTLKVFHLHRSGVDDEKVRVLISHVLDHPSLLTLGT